MILWLRIQIREFRHIDMKNKKEIIEGFKAVDFMRKTRDEISKSIADLTFEEIKKVFQKAEKQLAITSDMTA